MPDLTDGQKLAKLKRWRDEHKLDLFELYPKQREFIAMGATFLERMLSAGNQAGKSDCGAYETAIHLTGLYPDDWEGLRFDHPVKGWAAGPSATRVRDVGQAKLFGDPAIEGMRGTGFIPKHCIVGEPTHSRSAVNSIETAVIRHYTNGIEDGLSTITFMTYEQERYVWQGTTLDFIWFDEEPKEELYIEGLARLVATNGRSWLTFTPLKGMSAVVSKFREPSLDDPFRHRRGYIVMALEDAAHMTPEKIENAMAGYPRYEWPMRISGEPNFAAGRIFETPEEQLMWPCPPLDRLPGGWAYLWGVDFGIDHPFAAVLLAIDRETNTGFILATIRMVGGSAVEHAAAMRRVAANVPVAWPHDGHVRDKGSGEGLAKIYRREGLNMLAEHSTLESGGYSTEAGIAELDNAMRGARFRVAENLADWFQEYRGYHRKALPSGDTQIVKLKDDLMSATRTAWIMRRKARPVALGSKIVVRKKITQARAIDPFTGRAI